MSHVVIPCATKSTNDVKWRAQLFGKDCTLKRTPRGRKRLVCANPDDEKEIKNVHGSGDHDPLMHYLEWIFKNKFQNKPITDFGGDFESEALFFRSFGFVNAPIFLTSLSFHLDCGHLKILSFCVGLNRKQFENGSLYLRLIDSSLNLFNCRSWICSVGHCSNFFKFKNWWFSI